MHISICQCENSQIDSLTVGKIIQEKTVPLLTCTTDYMNSVEWADFFVVTA